jgi:hypothetical protein
MLSLVVEKSFLAGNLPSVANGVYDFGRLGGARDTYFFGYKDSLVRQSYYPIDRQND